jgi:hypothetical protein
MSTIVTTPDPRNPVTKAPNEYGIPVVIGKGRRVRTLGERLVLRVLRGGPTAQGFLTYTAAELRNRGQRAALIME